MRRGMALVLARRLRQHDSRRRMDSIVLAAGGCRKAIDMGQLQADAGATVHGVMWTVTDQSKALRVLRGGEVGATLVGHSCIAAKAATTAKVLLGLSRLWTVARGAIVCGRIPSASLRKAVCVGRTNPAASSSPLSRGHENRFSGRVGDLSAVPGGEADADRRMVPKFSGSGSSESWIAMRASQRLKILLSLLE